MSIQEKAALIYLSVISIISIIVTVYDKTVSKISGHRRVPEIRLILLSALGGSAAMLVTMLIIRHKTRHIKFMLGIPMIIVFQLIVVYYFFFFV